MLPCSPEAPRQPAPRRPCFLSTSLVSGAKPVRVIFVEENGWAGGALEEALGANGPIDFAGIDTYLISVATGLRQKYSMTGYFVFNRWKLVRNENGLETEVFAIEPDVHHLRLDLNVITPVLASFARQVQRKKGLWW